jgi:trigger factor
MSQSEEKEFSLKIPENFWEKTLAGKIADFKVKMGQVNEREIPEINDDFIQSVGRFESLEALKKNISEGLLMEKEIKEKERFRIEIADKIAAKTELELPVILIKQECEKMLNELNLDVESRGLKFEDYLSQIKRTADNLKEEFREPAQRRVRIALILRAVAQKEKIEPTSSEIKEKMNEVLKCCPDIKTAEKKVNLAELYERIAGILTNEKVFEYLESLTKK